MSNRTCVKETSARKLFSPGHIHPIWGRPLLYTQSSPWSLKNQVCYLTLLVIKCSRCLHTPCSQGRGWNCQHCLPVGCSAPALTELQLLKHSLALLASLMFSSAFAKLSGMLSRQHHGSLQLYSHLGFDTPAQEDPSFTGGRWTNSWPVETLPISTMEQILVRMCQVTEGQVWLWDLIFNILASVYASTSLLLVGRWQVFILYVCIYLCTLCTRPLKRCLGFPAL
jgi:hypothetical protein